MTRCHKCGVTVELVNAHRANHAGENTVIYCEGCIRTAVANAEHNLRIQSEPHSCVPLPMSEPPAPNVWDGWDWDSEHSRILKNSARERGSILHDAALAIAKREGITYTEAASIASEFEGVYDQYRLESYTEEPQ
jgi:hypothetical protein